MVQAIRFIGTLFAAVGVALSAGRSSSDSAAVPAGEPALEPATLHSLGVYWIVRGDADEDARVEVQYRVTGRAQWRPGPPLFRVERGAERAEGRQSRIEVPEDAWLFAGSLLLLRPDTAYELKLRLHDPDGGEAERLLRARTLAEPLPPPAARQFHVVPGDGGGSGTASDPFRGLPAAQALARPGDAFLLHAGVYAGTFKIERSGEPGRPIRWVGAGDGEVIIDGQGDAPNRPGRAIDAVDAHDVWFEKLTLRNADHGIVAHDAARLVIRRCHIHAVEFGITLTRNERDTTRGFFIADNVIEGPSTWPRTKGIEDARGIQVTGAGHVVCYNRIRGFADAIDTFPSARCAAIDFHNNDVYEMTDDGIEMDYSERNTRCFYNRLTNVFQGISCQPVYGGPVYIFRNVLYNVGIETFKLHNSPSGALMIHNTSVKKGVPLLLWTPAAIHHCVSRNNLFVGTPGSYAYECTAPMVECDYDYDGFAGGPWQQFLRWNGERYATLADVRARAPVYRHAAQIDASHLFASRLMPPRDEAAPFDRTRVDLRLAPRSGAIDAAEPLPGFNDGYTGRAPDLGAYEMGARLPHYGPRLAPRAALGSGLWALGWGRGDGKPLGRRTAVSLAKSQEPRAQSRSRSEPGVVSHVRILSDKVEDVSSMEAWQRSFIRPGMTDAQKGIAIWETVVKFRHQDPPPNEYLQSEADVHDAIKTFNVYGYGMCCCASANIAALGRYIGLPARGRILNGHSVPELFWDGGWHLLDASLINYVPDHASRGAPDGQPAGVDEIMADLKTWYARHPDLKGNDAGLRAFMRGGGWKNGPEILRRSPFYDQNGWLPAATHGWYSTMQEYDGSAMGFYEYGYSQGYQVNVQLRRGERLTRRWSNRGLHVNQREGGEVGCLTGVTGRDDLRYAPRYGDLAPGRIGNGTLEWDVPLADGAFRAAALSAENLAGTADDGRRPALHLRDPARPGTLVFRMPSSYVYLDGKLSFQAVVGQRGRVEVFFSDNHGLDWKPVATVTSSGARGVDLKPLVHRRYDYRLRFVFRGPGTGLDSLRLMHTIQHSQRALPALGQGSNRITFNAGPDEGTITLEGGLDPKARGKQLVYTDFHPQQSGLHSLLGGATGGGVDAQRTGTLPPFLDPWLSVASSSGQITFPVATPGDMRRLRLGAHYRARAPEDGWDVQVSFDGGRSFRPVTRLAGPTTGNSQYVTLTDIPAGTRAALVRWSGTRRDTTCLFGFRIDADYREPAGGFAPIRITYVWEEGGVEKRHVHVATAPRETYTIDCSSRPVMKRLIVERADTMAVASRRALIPSRVPTCGSDLKAACRRWGGGCQSHCPAG